MVFLFVLLVPFVASVLGRLFRIDWQALLDPRIKSAVERMRVFPTTIREFLRHPGAGCFVRSSAVGYDRAVLWNLIEMFRDLIGRHAQSVR